LGLRRSATPAAIAALGFAVALAGDACHVASGTTRYDWTGVPEIWRSRLWFPFLVAAAVLLAAWMGRRADLPGRRRDGRDVVLGAAAVLGLYALTAVLRGQPATVSVILCGALAALIWAWWDTSPSAFVIAAGAAIAGPLAEILLTSAGAASYAADSDDLAGVAPWLPCLYFAAGAVASGLWVPMERALRDLDPREASPDSGDRHG
jgi:hypothetical protein